MSRATICLRATAATFALAVAVNLGVQASAPATAAAEGPEVGVAWRLEQPRPPKAPLGQPESSLPVGLGKVGDIEFTAPNRGLLITEGTPPTIPAGIWAYNGVEWHEIATECGATNGRIAWAGPSEFWTVSDGRPGQASESSENVSNVPNLEDNTLCHFAGGQVVGSYAHPAFGADAYTHMDAAACLGPSDCWFGGEPLQGAQVGAFQLHWNGSSLEAEPYPEEGHAIGDMRVFDGHIYESVRLEERDRSTTKNGEPPVVHRIEPEGTLPQFAGESLPVFQPTLDFLRLSALEATPFAQPLPGEEALWGAAGPQPTNAATHAPLTVVRRSEGNWIELIGPEKRLGEHAFPEEQALFPEGAEHASVSAIAAEPGTESAWIALAAQGGGQVGKPAALLHVSSTGDILEATTLPSTGERGEGVGNKGSAAKLACPAVNDCWLVTTQGWLYHLAPEGERTLPRDEKESEYFKGLITFRPADQGLPQVPPDAPPPDTSGLVEEAPNYGGTFAEVAATAPAALGKVALPLLSHMHSRLVHGSTLELRFHLAVTARVRLIAKRKKQVVASTPDRTLKAGNRSLLLALNPRRWPTKLSLQTRALAPLPLVSSVTGEGANVTTESTGLFVLPRTPLPSGSGLLP
jgi:hypothetical protein